MIGCERFNGVAINFIFGGRVEKVKEQKKKYYGREKKKKKMMQKLVGEFRSLSLLV